MRQLVLIALKVSVSVALLYFAVSRMNFTAINERLSRMELGWIAAAMAIALLQIALSAIRWQRIVTACGATLALRKALRFSLIASFFNQVLPSTIGGDAARIWLLAQAGAGWKKATYSVLLDRFIGVLALTALVAAGLYWSLGLIKSPVAQIMLAVIGLGGLSAGAAFLMLGRWRSLDRWRLTRRLAEMAALAGQMLSSPRTGPQIVTLSLLIQIMTALMAWCLARAVAAQFDFVHAFLLVLPVMLIATVPISIAGWGVRESALVLAFSYAGLAEVDGLIVSVLLGGVMLAVGVVGGIAWMASFENLPSKARAQS
ncbi:MAG: glycosyltransferase 2 family protein [Alphaproteobacteria bacterium]|jgi:uncharacterized membrane protein YbhN (UPF0104 family)|nr:glycosyltransferase 2 family protein [Alphaproteobacteria bacterium]